MNGNTYQLVLHSLTGVQYRFTVRDNQTLGQIIDMILQTEPNLRGFPHDGVDFLFSLITGETGISVYDYPLNNQLRDVLMEGIAVPEDTLHWYIVLKYLDPQYPQFREKVHQRWREFEEDIMDTYTLQAKMFYEQVPHISFTVDATDTLADVLDGIFSDLTEADAPVGKTTFLMKLLSGEIVSVYDFPLDTPIGDILMVGIDEPGSTLLWHGLAYLETDNIRRAWRDYTNRTGDRRELILERLE
jgi:hypothetical protein